MNRLRVMEMIDRPSLGGGQKAVLLLASGLDRSRFEVSVCSAGGGPLVAEIEKLGLAHCPASFGRKRWRENIRGIRRVLKSGTIDILHTHGGVAGFFGRWAAWQAGTPVVVHTLHGIHYLHYRNPLAKWALIRLERQFSRLTDRVVLVSEADRGAASRHNLAPERKLVVIRNGVDLRGLPDAEGVKRRRAELGLAGTGPVIGTVARLHRQKGVVYLVRAAAQVKARFPGLRIVCVGGGPLEADIRREVRRLGLEGTVMLLGEVEDPLPTLAVLDVFVLPSLWEGLPFVLIEAAALAKPIVATDVEGNREVITAGETGLLVPPADPAALADDIVGVLRDPEMASHLAASAARTIPPRFTLARMVRQTEELYLAAWDEKRPPGA